MFHRFWMDFGWFIHYLTYITYVTCIKSHYIHSIHYIRTCIHCIHTYVCAYIYTYIHTYLLTFSTFRRRVRAHKCRTPWESRSEGRTSSRCGPVSGGRDEFLRPWKLVIDFQRCLCVCVDVRLGRRREARVGRIRRLSYVEKGSGDGQRAPRGAGHTCAKQPKRMRNRSDVFGDLFLRERRT